MSKPTRSRSNSRPSELETALAEPDLYTVLTTLGYRPTERVSINTRLREGRFQPRLAQVGDLKDWETPLDRNVWFGVNPISRSVRRGRGTEVDIVRARVLFADLDVKDGSLASFDEGREVIDRLARMLGTPPAVVVESGHGLQPYWRLASPPSESTRIAEVTTRGGAQWSRLIWRETYGRWGALVQKVVREVHPSARIDDVYQLSHIMRCPGSLNHKADPVVPVVTRIYRRASRVSREKLKFVLDDNDVRPLGGAVAPLAVKIPTGLAEAERWVNGQPGADADLNEMSPYLRRKFNYRDLVAEFSSGTDDERSAHNLMRNRVKHAVLASTEGNSGLALCLILVREAYLEVMEKRQSGEIAGEARSASVALGDFHRSLVGAVAVARGRLNSPLPLRDCNGEIYLPTAQGA